jgi:eukaryotic-like serine/threonine-protein kinase
MIYDGRSFMEAPLDLGRYRLYGPIASGGMATVHFGRLIGEVGFSRTVAIKRVHPKRLDRPEMVTGLVDEARLVSRIQHPNVVPTLDVFVANGEVFVVMEYVVGETLSKLLRGYIDRQEPVPCPIALSVGVGMLRGLHAAHEAASELGKPLEIVHRDVSPQNLMVGVDGLARVLDFGIAKATVRLSSTMSGQVKGKFRYMAPEQVRGERVTRRADVFAAGIVLWEALAGRRLYQTDSDVARALAFKEEPPALSEHNAEVPHSVSQLLRRAMQAEPEERFPDAGSFADALEDAAEVAPARRVGEWVRSVAEVALQKRAQTIVDLERHAALQGQGSAPDDATTSDVVPPPGERTESALTTQLVEAETVRDRRPASVPGSARPARRASWLLLGAVGLGGGAWWASTMQSEPAGHDAAPPAVPAPLLVRELPSGTVEADPRKVPAPAAAPSAHPGDAVAPSAPAGAPVTAAPEPAAIPFPPVVKPIPSAGATGKPPPLFVPEPALGKKTPDPCDPPYTIDENGIQRFREECL